MKKVIVVFLTILMTASLCSCAKKSDKVELNVFAAASMTETLNEIAQKYQEENQNVKITYAFDSSGTLKTQINEGAECDIFVSAAQKQMNEIDDLVTGRINLVENKVVLAVPEGNPAQINSYEDLKTDRLKLICLGNEDVPVGDYSISILTYEGILDELEKEQKITYASNVKEVTTQIKQASVDCGIIYATDANAAGLTVVDEATNDMCGQVIYPVAMIKASKNSTEAQKFLDYLTGDEAVKIFESAGFKMAGNE